MAHTSLVHKSLMYLKQVVATIRVLYIEMYAKIYERITLKVAGSKFAVATNLKNDAKEKRENKSA